MGDHKPEYDEGTFSVSWRVRQSRTGWIAVIAAALVAYALIERMF